MGIDIWTLGEQAWAGAVNSIAYYIALMLPTATQFDYTCLALALELRESELRVRVRPVGGINISGYGDQAGDRGRVVWLDRRLGRAWTATLRAHE